MDIECRMKQIEDIHLFIQDKQKMLNNVLEQLEWKEESLIDEIKVPCGRNSEHWIPQSALLHHQKLCEWIGEGYIKEELEKESPDSSFFYEKSSEGIPVVIDAATQEKVLSERGLIRRDQIGILDFPKTIDRWTVQLNPEQRLAMYNYVIEVAKAADKQPKNVTMEDLIMDFEKKEEQDEKPKSQLEILAEMRDYKRRRQSYRAKNVHITKKSYTEIMKEVIENQTSYLAETRKYENSINRKIGNEICDDPFPREAEMNYCEDLSSFTRQKKKHSEHTEFKDDSRSHHRSNHGSSKKKKHKNRSRSRSPSRHKHKKSHRKRKRSYDTD